MRAGAGACAWKGGSSEFRLADPRFSCGRHASKNKNKNRSTLPPTHHNEHFPTHSHAHLCDKDAHEGEGEPLKLVVPDELIQIEVEELKDQAEVVAMEEKVLQGWGGAYARASVSGSVWYEEGGLYVRAFTSASVRERASSRPADMNGCMGMNQGVGLNRPHSHPRTHLEAHNVMLITRVCPGVEELKHPYLHSRLMVVGGLVFYDFDCHALASLRGHAFEHLPKGAVA
jgi:hypothetical protein